MKDDLQIQTNNGNIVLGNNNEININYESHILPILTKDPEILEKYFPRNDDAILEKLQKNKLLLITGIGGIGKTEIAKEIYRKVKENGQYDYFAWIDYTDDLESSLNESLIAVDNEKYRSAFDFLTQLQKNKEGNNKKIIIIIDNYNNINGDELSMLKRINADILITSRSTINFAENVEITKMSDSESIALFEALYNPPQELKKSIKIEIKKRVKELLPKVNGYPLAIGLIAKNLNANHKNYISFLENLYEQFNDEKKFRYEANDSETASYYEKIYNVYKCSELSEEELRIMKLISIINPGHKIMINDIKDFLGDDFKTELDRLMNRGWVKVDFESINVHEVIANCVLKSEKISYDEIQKILDFFLPKVEVDKENNIKESLKYARYILNVVEIISNGVLCKHKAIKEAALIFKELGYYDTAKELLNKSIKVFDEKNEPDRIVLAELYNNYAKIFAMEGNNKEALGYSKEAELLIDSVNDKSNETIYQRMVIKKTVAMYYGKFGEYEKAQEKISQALPLAQNLPTGLTHQLANLKSDAAALLYDMGQIQESQKMYEETIKIYDEFKNITKETWRCTTYTNFVEVLLQLKEYQSANKYGFYSLSGKLYNYPSDNIAIANALLGLGKVYESQQRVNDIAAKFYERAIEIYRNNKNVDKICDAYARLSFVTRKKTYVEEAYNIIINSDLKLFSYDTYASVMQSMANFSTNEAIQIGEKMLSVFEKYKEKNPANQYICALMVYCIQKLDVTEINKSKEYKYNVDTYEDEDSIKYENRESVLYHDATINLIDSNDDLTLFTPKYKSNLK